MTDRAAAETLRQVRDQFPVTRRFAYFNVAANCPLALPVRQAIEDYARDLSERGAVGYRDWFETYRTTRGLAARLLGARPAEVAFVHSTSEGLALVANGLGLGPGDSVVIVNGDFPANVYPWLALKKRGVAVRFAEPDAAGRVPPERILAACDATTRVVSVSFVAFSTGYRMDLAALGAALAARGILFCVDAIQGIGVLPLDVRACGIDFLSADGHKGLLTPEGIGVFYVREELLDRLEPTHVSWLSMKDPFETGSYRGVMQDDARRFEYATPNTAGIYALKAAIELILGIGVETIGAHVLGVTGELCGALERKGWRVRSPRGAGEGSGIVSFEKQGVAPRAAVERLLERGVVVAERAGAVRASAHVYNDASDVERLIDALPA